MKNPIESQHDICVKHDVHNPGPGFSEQCFSSGCDYFELHEVVEDPKDGHPHTTIVYRVGHCARGSVIES